MAVVRAAALCTQVWGLLYLQPAVTYASRMSPGPLNAARVYADSPVVNPELFLA